MGALVALLVCVVIGYLIAGGFGALIGLVLGLVLVYTDRRA